LLALMLLGVIVKDAFSKKREPAPPGGGTQVKVEGEDKDSNPGGGGGKEGFEVPIDPTPRIQYVFDGKNDFGVTVIRDQLGNNTHKLLTYSGSGQTNSTVLKIDGMVQQFGFGGNWLQRDPPVPGRNNCKFIWQHNLSRVEITQVLDIVPSMQPADVGGVQKRLLDTCLVAYQIENKDTRPHTVGFRMQVDTLIGNNDGVPFAVPGLPGLVNTSADYWADKVPDFIQALEFPDVRNPGTVAHMTVKLGRGFEPPGRVSLTHWPGMNFNWEIPVQNMFNDSAIVLYWNEKQLQPGEKRKIGFAYGLGSVSSTPDAGGPAPGGSKLGLTLSGSFEPGEEFTVSAYVSNPQAGQTVTLNLPAGLKRVQGEQTQTVQQPVGAASSLVTWKVSVEKVGRYDLSVQSSTGAVQRRTITISRPDPITKKDNADSIFK
jgi:hypothetical protein